MDELPGALVLGLPEELRRGSVLDDLAHQLRVEGRGRLVEEQQLGSQREGADDPDSLLLPAGQRRRMARLLGPEAGPAEQLAGLCDRDRPRASLNNDRAFDDVLKDGLVREEVVVLEDDRAPVTQSVQLGAAGARREVDHLPVGPRAWLGAAMVTAAGIVLLARAHAGTAAGRGARRGGMPVLGARQ